MVTYDYDKNGNVIKEASIELDKNIVSSKNFVYDINAYRLSSIENKTIDLNSISATASNTSVGPDEQITFSLSGNINTTDTFLNEVLGNTAWSSNSSKLVFNSIKGVSITASIPKANWDQMLADERIVVRATLLNKIYEVSIMKKKIALSSVSMTPTSVVLAGGEYRTFSLSGKMSDGTIASRLILNGAEWTVSSPKLTLSTTVGSTTTVVISQAVWDQMPLSEILTLKATISGKTLEATISKKYIAPPTLSNINISPVTTYYNAGGQKNFVLSGTMSDGGSAPDTALNQAVWTVNSTKLSLNTTTGKTVIGTISQASWDQMTYDEVITLTAVANGVSESVNVYKVHPLASQLQSLSITPSSATMYVGESCTFTISGIMTNGSAAPESLLSTARWNLSERVSDWFTLQNSLGMTNSVRCNDGTVVEYSKGLKEDLNGTSNTQTPLLGGSLFNNNLIVRIGNISTGAYVTQKESGGTWEMSIPQKTTTENGLMKLEQDVTTSSSLIIDESNIETNDLANAENEEVTLLSTIAENTLLVSAAAANLVSTISLYSYDLNGNLISIKDGNGNITASYEYDEQNQLITLTNSQGATSYTYNPEGLRSSKTQGTNKTGYYYDGDNVIIETINNILSARNIMGINPIAREVGSLKLYYLYNGHADVIAMVDAAGTVVNSYSYDIYGNIVLANEAGGANPIRYAGQYYDNESEMYYLRARYYDPELMRFISEDTYKGDVKDPLSLNLYSYCTGNPVNYFDPDGHDKKKSTPDNGDNAPATPSGAKGTGTGIKPSKVSIKSGNSSNGGNSGTKQTKWKTVDYKGTKVYQDDSSINLQLKDKFGRTNLERMKKGLSPIGPDGKPINLHHSIQMNDGPIIELSQTTHQKYTKILHINPITIPSGIDRIQFGIWRSNYWIDRVAGLIY